MNALPILEAAYDLDAGVPALFAGVARATAASFPRGGAVAVFRCDRGEAIAMDSCAIERGSHRWVDAISSMRQSMNAGQNRAMYETPPALVSPAAIATAAQNRRAQALSLDNLVGLLGTTGGDSAIGVALAADGHLAWPDELRRYWSQVAEHLAASWRLRLALQEEAREPVAELTSEGEERHGGGALDELTTRQALRRAVRLREQQRRRRRSASSGELWPALIAGRWTILDEYEASGARRIVVYENPPGTTALRALVPRDAEILRLLAEGRAGKWIAAELQLSESSVTRALQRALRSVGAAKLSALAALHRSLEAAHYDLHGASVAVVDASFAVATPPPAALTAAEAQIFALLREGLTARDIAQRRRVAVRTIRNQAASLYRKLAVNSRRELLFAHHSATSP